MYGNADNKKFIVKMAPVLYQSEPLTLIMPPEMKKSKVRDLIDAVMQAGERETDQRTIYGQLRDILDSVKDTNDGLQLVVQTNDEAVTLDSYVEPYIREMTWRDRTYDGLDMKLSTNSTLGAVYQLRFRGD